jgi:radical SAM PhpK family P-methyltransferase
MERAMATIDCVIIGHNTGDFQEQVAARRSMSRWIGAYRDVQINSVTLDGRRIPYMELFNRELHRRDPRAEPMSAFDPLGLAGLHLTSLLTRRGRTATLVGEFQKGQARLAELLNEEPIAAAITTTFYFEPAPVAEIVDFIRARSPRTKIILGGPYPSQLDRSAPPEVVESTLRDTGADIVVIEAQGESTLALVVEALARGDRLADLASIPNLLVFDGEEMVRTARLGEDNPINENRVDWSLFDRALLQPFAMTRTAISCPFACSFCTYPVRAGDHRLADVERIEAELRELARIGVQYLYFIDDTFNVPLPRFKQLCRMMIRNRFPFRWLSYLRCGNMDMEAIQLAAESGCTGALLGIESGDRQVLQHMNKFADPDKYRRAIRALEDAGIMTWALFFVGFPGESERSVRNTIALLQDTAPSFYATQMWFYDQTTPIHHRAAEFNLQGKGYGWSHASMRWPEACDWVDAMLREVTQSLYVPQAGFSFETIFYLMGRGFSLDFIKGFLRIAHDWVVDGLGDRPVDQAAYLARLDTLRGAPAVH